MKKLSGVLFASLLCGNAWAGEDDFRCLVSVGMKNPIRLQFVFPGDNSDIGHVTYQNGSGALPVKRISERTVEEVPGGRPWLFESVWEENAKDGGGGKYVIQTQGARIEEFKYIRKKDGRVFKFEEDPYSTGEEKCEWKAKK